MGSSLVESRKEVVEKRVRWGREEVVMSLVLI